MTKEENIFLTSFYLENFESLNVYAYRFLSDWEDAHDVTQEAFKTAVEKIGEFSNSENHIGWMKLTIRKKAANWNRAKKIRNDRTEPMDEGSLKFATNKHYGDSAIAHCVELLPSEEFAMIEASILAGEPYSEAYKNFDLSYEAFRKRVSRILKKLRDHWDP